MLFALYNILLIVSSPIILGILLAKKRCRPGLPQRLGFENGWFGSSGLSGLFGGPERDKPDKPNKPNEPDRLDRQDRPVIWVHAVSLGEVVAVVPLIKELHRRHPSHRFIVSTATETGREAVEQRLAGVAEHRYAPLDFPWVVKKVIDRWRPSLYLFVETELWPNLLLALRRRGIPTVLVNGRLSTKSFARQLKEPMRSFYRATLRMLSLCLMQSERDVERIVALGADLRVVQCTGNIKFDQPAPEPMRLTRADLGITEHEQLFVAGSTHPVEEDVLVAAYRRIAAEYPSAVLMLAPRHIERVDQVETRLREQGMVVQRRTALQQGARPIEGPRVLILDTRGELASVYQEAAVAFVGGTLIPIGGHNLLEPAVCAKPVLFGPYTDHCVEIADLLIHGGGGVRVPDDNNVAKEVTRLLQNPMDLRRMGQSAREVIERNQGALQRTVNAIDTMLAKDQTGHEPSIPQRSTPLMVGR
jgi:3-deoxy-D-manno-octulosonic-acid transferase